MGGKDSNYQIVYRDECLQNYVPGGWVLFQRMKEYGGGFWLGKTFDGLFALELDHPVSLHDGIVYIIRYPFAAKKTIDVDDDFKLT